MTGIEDYLTSAMSTLQHIENLYDRAEMLTERRLDAEEQMLHRASAAFRTGRLDAVGLYEIYEQYKALQIPGRMARWNAVMPIKWQQMHNAVRWQPNEMTGTWSGTWPLSDRDHRPAPRVSVVYVLFDAHNEPIYVGSTADFRIRLKAHAKDGKPFVRWQAYPSADREAAYLLEDRLLRERKPRLNRKASR